MTVPARSSALLPGLVLLAVTALWGATFVVVKEAIAAYPPMNFLAARFLLAALVLGVFAFRNPREASIGLVIGTLLAVGYLAQTYGLLTVPASTAGLLTGMFVVFTPVCDAVLFRVRTPAVTLLATVVALVGMVAVTYGGDLGGGELLGEALVLLCALAFAAHIAYLSHHSRHHSAVGLAAWQMVACAAIFSLGGVATGGGVRALPPGPVLWALVVTGVGASALAFLAQTWVQRRLSAGRAALLLTAEPAFAVLFGVVLAHDRLSALRIAGAALILAALVGHEAVAGRRGVGGGLELPPLVGP